jgi:hypothetical protein
MATENELSEYYTGFKQSLHQRNYERAAGYLHLLYMNIGFHPSIISQITFEPLGQREFVRFIDIYLREFPDDPAGYLLHMSYHHGKARLDIIRKIWKDTCRLAVKGFHYQPGVAGSLFDAETGLAYTSLGGVGLGDAMREALASLVKSELNTRGEAKRYVTSGATGLSPTAVTCAGEPIGLNSVALNGTLSGFNIPTRYFFRYGMSPEKMEKTTLPCEMPAGVFASVCDGGVNLFRRMLCYASSVQFIEADAGNANANPASAVAMKLEWPFGKDRNHLDGIGVIDLFLGWQNPAQSRGVVEGIETPTPVYPSLTYCGEETDLRDAQLRVTYRSSDLNPKGFLPVAWLHGRTGTAAFPDEWDDLAAWAVTSDRMASTFIADGEWHDLEFNLPAHSSDWTFCGSNIEEMGGGMARYTYAPIQEVLRSNKGGNVCIAFVHGHDLDTPEGAIDISEIEMRYRSRSLLGPGQGAELVCAPDAGAATAGCLTNGSIGDIAQCYIVDMDKQNPIEMIWQLRDTASITGFRIHQCALAPAKNVELAGSSDGEYFSPLWSGELDMVPENPAYWGECSQNSKLLRAIVLEEKHEIRFIRLRILSAHMGSVVGLDALEVFGDGLPFIPSEEPFTLSEKIDDVDPGKTLYAQLVAENERGVFEGDVVEVVRPETGVPYIVSASLAAGDGGAAVLAARAIAMGKPAHMYISLISDDGGDVCTQETSIGQWLVPRDVRVRITGLRSGARYTGTCWAENKHGRSETVSLVYVA